MKTLYETRATAKAGRQGQVSTDDGLLDVALAYPKPWAVADLPLTQNNCLPQVIMPVSQTPFCMSLKSAKWILPKRQSVRLLA